MPELYPKNQDLATHLTNYSEFHHNSLTSSQQQFEKIGERIDKLINLTTTAGWDGTFIRQLVRWRDIALRDGREFRLNSKQLAHLSRIESRYLKGGDA